MNALTYAIGAALLLLLNAFFVLAEFAAVKLRSSRVEELVEQKRAGAGMIAHIAERLDEYLSLCQVGITFASIALGAVAEPLVHPLVAPFIRRLGIDSPGLQHGVIAACGIAIVSYVHVLLGEQVPKLIAIRNADRAALITGYPLRVFRWVFFVPLWLLAGSSRLVLRLIGLSPETPEEQHSEDELRIILGRSHSGGVMSFRRLLFMENVFDFGELKVRDAMRPRTLVRALRAGAPWDENLAAMREARYSRFPLVDGPPEKPPIGILHVKDLVIHHQEGDPDLRKLARPFITTHEDAPLEAVLTDMQRRRVHIAIALDKQGRWSGFLSMEDIIEEIIGTVEDEFASEPPIYLADVLAPARIVLGVEGATLPDAIRAALARVPADELPLPRDQVLAALLERERLVSTYLGRGIAMPHARLPRLVKPVLLFARADEGIPVPGRDDDERIRLLFILLTPAGLPRIHQRLQARIAGILESEFVDARLREAPTAQDVLEAIRTGEQTSLD